MNQTSVRTSLCPVSFKQEDNYIFSSKDNFFLQSDSENSDAAIKLKEKIKNVNIAMLTTEEKNGHLRSRPMHTIRVESTGVLWFFTSDQSDKADVIEHKSLHLQSRRGLFLMVALWYNGRKLYYFRFR